MYYYFNDNTKSYIGGGGRIESKSRRQARPTVDARGRILQRSPGADSLWLMGRSHQNCTFLVIYNKVDRQTDHTSAHF